MSCASVKLAQAVTVALARRSTLSPSFSFLVGREIGADQDLVAIDGRMDIFLLHAGNFGVDRVFLSASVTSSVICVGGLLSHLAAQKVTRPLRRLRINRSVSV